MVLFKNPRDATQFADLARQMYPKTSQFAVEAYKDATREPYSYFSASEVTTLRRYTNLFIIIIIIIIC